MVGVECIEVETDGVRCAFIIFARSFKRQRIFIDAVVQRILNNVIVQPLLAKLHCQGPAAAWAKAITVFNPRLGKLLIIE